MRTKKGVLFLVSWVSACLSLGYGQTEADASLTNYLRALKAIEQGDLERAPSSRSRFLTGFFHNVSVRNEDVHVAVVVVVEKGDPKTYIRKCRNTQSRGIRDVGEEFVTVVS